MKLQLYTAWIYDTFVMNRICTLATIYQLFCKLLCIHFPLCIIQLLCKFLHAFLAYFQFSFCLLSICETTLPALSLFFGLFGTISIMIGLVTLYISSLRFPTCVCVCESVTLEEKKDTRAYEGANSTGHGCIRQNFFPVVLCWQ